MSDTTRAIYRRSPLHLTRGSWLDVPRTVSATSAEQRADINRAVDLIKGKASNGLSRSSQSRSCSDFALRWQDTLAPSSDLSGVEVLRPKWSFEQGPLFAAKPVGEGFAAPMRACASYDLCDYAMSEWDAIPALGCPRPGLQQHEAGDLDSRICDDGSTDGSEVFLRTLNLELAECSEKRRAPEGSSPSPDARAAAPSLPASEGDEDRAFVRQVPWPGEDAESPTPAALAAKIRTSGHRLVVLNSGGRGQGAAQNACLEAATAPLIGLMDADDRGDPERFGRLLEALREHPDWQGACSAVRIFGAVSEGMERYVQWQNSLLQPEELWENRFVEIPGLHQSGVYPRSLLWDTLKGYRDLPTWPIDIDTWMRLAEAGARIGKVPDELYGWRQHVLQSTRNHGRCGIDRLRNCKAYFMLRSLPAQVRRVEIWSTGHTLSSWSETLQSQIHTLADSEEKELAISEVSLVSWRPKGSRRGGAKRAEGGGGAAARATVKTEAELEQEAEKAPNQGAKRQRQEINLLPSDCTSAPPPLSDDSVARVFVFGSEKLREKARQSIEADQGHAPRWGRLDWPSA
ncbi:rckA [Symbiodinium pilosum]|uniref:RckA protein n=1 Tax=Symbiodinium pilosum TaxID=2952 RepID=A0A812XI46_SYMPI|nr:rckA [Symbiodinium pilosum]